MLNNNNPVSNHSNLRLSSSLCLATVPTPGNPLKLLDKGLRPAPRSAADLQYVGGRRHSVSFPFS